MRCPHCGTWSEVLDTRMPKDGMTNRRRRQCANGHRFATREIYEPVFCTAKARQADFTETAQRRIALFERNANIRKRLAAGDRPKDIAAEHGISTSSVSLIARGKAR
jgi:transcriptional regulator NrdR family protein